MLDWKLTIGNILELLTMIGTIVYFILDMRWRLNLLQQTHEEFTKRFAKLEQDVEKLAEVATKFVEQDARLKMLEAGFTAIMADLKQHSVDLKVFIKESQESRSEILERISEISAAKNIPRRKSK